MNSPGSYRSASDAEDRIGIEFVSVFGLPPVDFVALAADLGCRHIGLALAPMGVNPHGYPAWSLREDASLRRDMIAAMGDRGVSISMGEGFMVRPGADISKAAADLDVMRELGVPRVNVLGADPDLKRTFDQFALFVEMAGARGLDTIVEFIPGMPVGDLPTALAAIRHVGKPNFRLLIDTMHLARSGSTAADIAALDPNLIGYIHLCDVPRVSKYASYGEEARDHRLPPGKGELPLRDILAALPRDLVVGLEVPMLEEAQAGVGPHQRLSGCVDAARDLLRRLDT